MRAAREAGISMGHSGLKGVVFGIALYAVALLLLRHFWGDEAAWAEIGWIISIALAGVAFWAMIMVCRLISIPAEMDREKSEQISKYTTPRLAVLSEVVETSISRLLLVHAENISAAPAKNLTARIRSVESLEGEPLSPMRTGPLMLSRLGLYVARTAQDRTEVVGQAAPGQRFTFEVAEVAISGVTLNIARGTKLPYLGDGRFRLVVSIEAEGSPPSLQAFEFEKREREIGAKALGAL